MSNSTRAALLTLIALVAFAGNSILCRQALGAERIDPSSFTAIRVGSGALVLVPLAWSRGTTLPHRGALPALTLAGYALGFSLAYQWLDTGTGALLLFGAVQVTMVGLGILRGERPPLGVWIGGTVAAAGLAILVAPGVSAPDPLGVLFMAGAGVCWGGFSLLGKGVQDPVSSTAQAFAWAALGCGLLALVDGPGHASMQGIGLAVASGAITSGLGYALWYAALAHHTATSAAIVQLSVPVIAAIGGVLLLDEAITARLVGAGVITLVGVAGAAWSRPGAPSTAGARAGQDA